MKIVVDADACPRNVLQICFELGQAYAVQVWTVASFNHRIESEHHIMVGDSSQEADLKLINISRAGDIAVTQDWGLAAMLLARGVRCLGPSGSEYTNEKIDFLLEERNLKARHRRGGGRTRGPKKRTLEQDQWFRAALEKILIEGNK